jgi:hypothetical protein
MSIAASAYSFLRGAAVSVGACATVYLAGDAISDTLILRECHRQVLPLALAREALTTELGGELQPGPWYSSMLRSTPSGRMYQCQFRLDGKERSSDVTATLYRPPYTSTALYNLFGPGEWELKHCHVLVGELSRLPLSRFCVAPFYVPRKCFAGGTGVQVRSVDLMMQPGDEPDNTQTLPAHLFHGKSTPTSQ